MPRAPKTLITPTYTLETALALEQAGMAIGRLDARVSASSVASAWRLRAAWTGYAEALHAQGVEIDEIDVFSWGCGIHVPGRARRTSLTDEFADFDPWQTALATNRGRHWREDLPFSLQIDPSFASAPMLARAAEITRQHAMADQSIAPWLALPILTVRLGMTATPLPCLVLDEKMLRASIPDPDALLRRISKSLRKRAQEGLASIDAIEADQARAIRALAGEHRPGALLKLATLMLRWPVLSPRAISRHMRVTLSGAGKLLSRAAALGLVQEVSARQSWRVYLTPSLAVALGFSTAPRGRPRALVGNATPRTPLADLFNALDREMREIDDRWPVANAADEERGIAAYDQC